MLIHIGKKDGNSLNLNPNKYVQCTFSLKGNVVTDPDLKATINDNALSAVELVTYLGVKFSNYAKWATRVEETCRKYVRLPLFCKETSKLINTC